MDKTCRSCGQDFTLEDSDLNFMGKVSPSIRGEDVSMPAPSHCPSCRQRRRLAFHNERNLYRRKCDKSGAEIVSVYSPAKPYKVYQADKWLSDDWSPLDYGVGFKASENFFKQFAGLLMAVPRMALRTINCENCEYNHNLVNSKNCYLTFGSANCENSFYCAASINIKECVDTWWSNTIELSGSIFCCDELYDCWFCDRCSYSRNLMFCRDCSHCTDCFGCANLSHAEYRIFNVQYSKEEYEDCLKRLNRSSYSSLSKIASQAAEFHLSQPYQAMTGELNENCTGDLIYRSVNCHDCFTAAASEDCRWMCESARNKDCRDLDFCYDCSGLTYESINSFYCFSSAFLLDCSQCSDSFYLMDCKSCRHCFGCIGLANAEYCILNKTYSKSEYFELLPKIIKQMRARGEWGEFFPAELSPFSYNETRAEEYFPMTREAAAKAGFRWEDQKKAAARPQIVSTWEVWKMSGLAAISQRWSFSKRFATKTPWLSRCSAVTLMAGKAETLNTSC